MVAVILVDTFDYLVIVLELDAESDSVLGSTAVVSSSGYLRSQLVVSVDTLGLESELGPRWR